MSRACRYFLQRYPQLFFDNGAVEIGVRALKRGGSNRFYQCFQEGEGGFLLDTRNIGDALQGTEQPGDSWARVMS